MITNNYVLTTNKLKNEISIVHISDIHFHKNFKKSTLDKILIKIEKLNPTYVCITGDLLDDNSVMYHEKINEFLDFIKKIKRKTLIVLGNHDVELKNNNETIYNEPINLLKELKKIENVHLDNYEENMVNFILYNPSYKYYQKGEHKQDITNFKNSKKGYNILLAHSPIPFTDFDLLSKNKIDLGLFGHMHGGMVPSFIKGNLGLISPYRKLFPKLVRGKIVKNDYTIIISSGITKLAPRAGLFSYFNFLYSKEISKITIKPLKK